MTRGNTPRSGSGAGQCRATAAVTSQGTGELNGVEFAGRRVQGPSRPTSFFEQIIYRHSPSGDGRLRLCNISASVDRRQIGCGGAIDSHDVAAEEIHVPHHQSPRGKIV